MRIAFASNLACAPHLSVLTLLSPLKSLKSPSPVHSTWTWYSTAATRPCCSTLFTREGLALTAGNERCSCAVACREVLVGGMHSVPIRDGSLWMFLFSSEMLFSLPWALPALGSASFAGRCSFGTVFFRCVSTRYPRLGFRNSYRTNTPLYVLARRASLLLRILEGGRARL